MKTTDIYNEVTARIIKELENGVIPWEKPWTGTNGAYSRSTGKNYSLLNQWLLPAGEYATFNQIKKEGGKVNKGAKSHIIVFWKIYTKEETAEDGTTTKKNIPVLKYYRVFNVETDTDLEKKWNKEDRPQGVDPIEELETIKDNYVNKYGIGFNETKGDRAFYRPSTDEVTVPLKEQFSAVAEYYSTVFHELGHSTGHKSRLDRLNTDAAFGSGDYSREELVAELTASGILANTGVETASSFRNNAGYIQSWIQALNDDRKMIIWASSRAEKAYDMIMSAEPEKPEKGAGQC